MKLPSLLVLLCTAQLAFSQTIYPPNIFADSAHAPFLHGVASGDPLSDAVILWTRITPASLPSAPLDVMWEISPTADFTTIMGSGTVTTDSTRDWTVKVDATGLSPYSDYHYRFSHGGNQSAVGRTRTAPSGPLDHLRVAAGSCSSVFSGYYNAYRRIAERNDLDLMLHVGDYIYDYADADEEVRMPVPMLPDPGNLREWRAMHAYNCLDPDLRAAKARLPWVMIWDNHDVDSPDSASLRQAIQAFHEWTPTRLPDASDSLRIFRTLHYGQLLDILMMDVLLYRDTDTLPDGQPVFIGDAQFDWLKSELSASISRWKILGSQNMMGHFLLTGLPGWIPFGDGAVMDSSTWDGYGSERNRVLQFLDSAGIDNVMVVSGDSHISTTQDLDPDPTNPSSYDPVTGNGAVAVEFLPTSISRGNLDEMGLGFAEGILVSVTDAANPHHLHKEFHSHGYGIIDIRPDSVVAEYWYSEILAPVAAETFAGGWVVRDGDNHWQRNATTTPTDTSVVGIPESSNSTLKALLYPNPTSSFTRLHYSCVYPSQATLRVHDVQGRILSSSIHNLDISGEVELDFGGYSTGTYWIELFTTHGKVTLPLEIR